MNKIKFFIVILLCLFLTGCDYYGTNEGVIIDKKHINAQTFFVPIYNGQTTIMIPSVLNEKWEIKIFKIENGDIKTK